MGTLENTITIQNLTGPQDPVGLVNDQTMVDSFCYKIEVNGLGKTCKEEGLKEKCDSGEKIEALVSGVSGMVEDNGHTQNDVACETAVGEGERKESLKENCVAGTENVENLGVEAVELQETVEDRAVACEEQNEVEKERGDEEGMSSEACRFSVGELVWAKTLNRPWWPGQIYDPSDASKDIAMYNRKDRVLVAFFGEEMSAWCYPSLVKSFQENFVEMSVQGTSTSFNKAVEEALRTVGRCVESQMTCFCAPPEVQTNLARPLASSTGIRQGVVVPECRINGLSVADFEPTKFVSRLKCISEIVSDISLLERTVFQSQLLSYNRANGRCHSDMYLKLLGLSDGKGVDGNVSTYAFDFDDPAGKPLGTPHEVDGPSTPGSNGIVVNSSFKKRRSKNDRLTSDSPKKRKSKGSEVGTNGDSALSDSNDLTLKNDDVEAKEGNKTGFLSRERRKSKYLSPPYTNLSRGCKSLIASKDSAPNSPKTPKASHGESMGTAVGLTKCSGGTVRKKQISGIKIDANVDASEVLSEFYSAALDSMYLEASRKYDYIKDFFVNFRRYRYLPDHQIDTELDSLRRAMRKTGHPTNEEGAETRGAKEGAKSHSPRKKYAEIVFGFPGEDMDQPSHSTALGGTEMNAKQTKKNATSRGPTTSRKPLCHSTNEAAEKRKRKTGAMSHSPQKSYVDIVVGLAGKENAMSQSPLKKNAGHRRNGKGTDEGEGKEGALSNILPEKYVDVAVNLTGTEMHGANHPTALGGTEMNANDANENSVSLSGSNLQKRKGRDWKEDARSRNRQSTFVDIPVVSPGEGMHESNCPTSEGVTESSRQYSTEDSRFQISQGKLIDVAVGSAGKYLPKTDCPTPKGGPRKRIRKKKNATSEGLQIRSEKAAALTKKKTHRTKLDTSAALLLNFGPGVPLPTKEDLIALFGRFGTLNEVETQVLKDTESAQVIFINRSNAEEAFTSSRKVSPFGAAVVNYRLEGYTTNLRASKPMVNSIQCIPKPIGANASVPLSALPPNGEAPPLSYLRQNLQSMTSTLEKEGNNLEPEMKAQLESQIKKLMKKLEIVV